MSYEEYSRTIKSYSDWLRATSDVDGLRNYRKVYTELFPHNDDNGNIKENPEIRTYEDFLNNVRLEFSHDSRESYFDMYLKFFPRNDDVNTLMKIRELKHKIDQGILPRVPPYTTADADSDDSNYDLESFNDYSGLYPELGESRKMETKEDDDFEYDGDEKGIELKPLLKKPNGGGRRTRRTRRTRRNKSKKSRKTKKPRKYRKSRKPRK
jgi:hypothetical protein